MDNLMDNLMDVIRSPEQCVAEPTRKLGQHAWVRILGNPRILQFPFQNKTNNTKFAYARWRGQPDAPHSLRLADQSPKHPEIYKKYVREGGWQERATFQTMSTPAALESVTKVVQTARPAD